jgi:hypothetical protein
MRALTPALLRVLMRALTPAVLPLLPARLLLMLLLPVACRMQPAVLLTCLSGQLLLLCRHRRRLMPWPPLLLPGPRQTAPHPIGAAP